MDGEKLIKIRLTVEEAQEIGRAVGQQAGESLTSAIKKFFKTRGHIKAQADEKESSL